MNKKIKTVVIPGRNDILKIIISPGKDFDKADSGRISNEDSWPLQELRFRGPTLLNDRRLLPDLFLHPGIF
jgi:hypothetical protein